MVLVHALLKLLIPNARCSSRLPYTAEKTYESCMTEKQIRDREAMDVPCPQNRYRASSVRRSLGVFVKISRQDEKKLNEGVVRVKREVVSRCRGNTPSVRTPESQKLSPRPPNIEINLRNLPRRRNHLHAYYRRYRGCMSVGPLTQTETGNRRLTGIPIMPSRKVNVLRPSLTLQVRVSSTTHTSRGDR